MPKPRDQHQHDHTDHTHADSPDRDGPARAAHDALHRQVAQLEKMASDSSTSGPDRLRAMELLAALAGLRVGSSVREHTLGGGAPAHTPREHRPEAHGPRGHGSQAQSSHRHGPPRRPKHDRPGDDRHGDDRHDKKGVRNRGASKFADRKTGGEPRRLDSGATRPLSGARPVRRLPSGG